MRRLTHEVEEASRRKTVAEVEAAHALETARAEAAAAAREVEVLRAGAGAAQDQALAALKVCASPPHGPCCKLCLQSAVSCHRISLSLRPDSVYDSFVLVYL